MKKRMLMIADADGFWTMRLLKYLILPQGYEVVLFPIWGDGGKYADFYRENNVTVYHDRHTLPVIGRIPRVRMWARIMLNARKLIQMGPFDVVNNCYLSQRDLALGDLVARKFGAHWVVSFWGSDLMRSSPLALRRMKPYLKRSCAVSVHNQLNVDMIRDTFGEEIAQKTHLLYFGQMGYADIDRALEEHGREKCRAHFGIASDRFVVSIGYSASSAQQQREAVAALAQLPQDVLSRMTLVLQQTYGENDADYVRQTREMAGRLPCQTVVLTRFMGPEESAMLRLSADVFVQSITTDAFSASMQEYLYAGACVLKGKWLQYPQLGEMGIELQEFADFSELPGLLTRAINGSIQPLGAEKRALFPQLYSWDAVRESWLELYEE
ncbi:MAG: glycosyltransferase family 4 protein [Clostridia bacterium]|nr:glycosyltransferase family 4 protein [Clostridia bacterium]